MLLLFGKEDQIHVVVRVKPPTSNDPKIDSKISLNPPPPRP